MRLRLSAGVQKSSSRAAGLGWVVLGATSRDAATSLLHCVVCYDVFCFVRKASIYLFIYFKVSRYCWFMVRRVNCLVFVKPQVRTEGFSAGRSAPFDPSADDSCMQLKYALLHLKGLEEDWSPLGQNSAWRQRIQLSRSMSW